jgi:hypothetical protein
VDSSTIFETDENVFVLFHDQFKDRRAEGEPLLLSDLFPLELLDHCVVLIDDVFIHYREDIRGFGWTGQLGNSFGRCKLAKVLDVELKLFKLVALKLEVLKSAVEKAHCIVKSSVS